MQSKKMQPQKSPAQPTRKQAATPKAKPMTKDDAIRQMVEKDPEKAAAMLRQILKNL